jgi:hypothetical protein
VAETRALDERLKAGVLAETFDTSALERRVMRRIAEESATRFPEDAMPARRRFLWPLAAFGTLAAAAAAMVSFVVYQSVKPKPSPYSLAAAHDHRLEVVEGQLRRWRLDIPSAEVMASTHGIPTALVSAVESAGFTFKEAKLCRLSGVIFLHLVYLDGNQEFSLYLRHEDTNPAGGPKRLFTTEGGQEHIAGFRDGALEALVVTDQPGKAALRIARAAAQVI